MRQIVDIASVAHLWAHQSQDHAKSHSGTFYFHGADIFSYGPHFRCGSVVKNESGERACLITTRKYSKSTGKHMCYVKDAIPVDALRFDTDRIPRLKNNGRLGKYDHQEALFFIIDRLDVIDVSIRSQMKAISTDYLNTVQGALLDIGRWIKFWGLDQPQLGDRGEWLPAAIQSLLSTKKAEREFFWDDWYSQIGRPNVNGAGEVPLQKLLVKIVEVGLIQDSANDIFAGRVRQLFVEWSGDPQIWEKFDSRFQRHTKLTDNKREARRRHFEEQQEIRRMALEDRIEKWRGGELTERWLDIGYDKPYNVILRVRKGNIETSKGITINPAEAKRLWPLIERFHKNDTSFVVDSVLDADNHRWRINAYQNDIMTAGCHRLSYEEMKRCIAQLEVAA